MLILFHRCPRVMKQFHAYHGILIWLQKRFQTAVSKKAIPSYFC